MEYADAFRRCLEECDTVGIRRLWQHVSPHLPQPQTDADALVAIHIARTQAKSVRFKLRAYSHRWLTDNGYPSAMPDELRPKAERIYPKIVDAVGISVKPLNPLHKALCTEIQSAMSSAVLEAYDAGKKDPVFVRARMTEARERVLKQH